MQKIISKLMIIFLCLISLVGCGEYTTEAVNVVEEVRNTSQNELKDTVKIHFIDTGNSDAILIQQGNQGVLIDGGDNDDEKIVPDYIKEQGVDTLKFVFATHSDADHIGGLDGVLKALEVQQVLVGNGDAETKTYRDFLNAIMEKGLSPSVPLIGSTYTLGDGVFEVLSAADMNEPNNNSIVLLYTYGNNHVLFMGDAGREIERTLNVGDVDLIKVGHHGSRTSSDPSFIAQVSPEYAVITCGQNNKYNHPHAETLNTLESLGVNVYRTDECGTIIFDLTGDTLYKEGENKADEKEAFTQDEISKQEVENKEVQEVISENSNMSKAQGIVYYTKSGKKYHYDKNCSNMKDPISGTLDEVGTREACKKCVN